jgi:hypothetical protein
MYPPPPVHPSELRPRRGWYVFAAAFATIMIALGVGGFAWGIVTAIRSAEVGQQFVPGQAVTVPMAPTPRAAIYIQVAGQQGSTPPADCRILGPTGTSPDLSPSTTAFTTTLNGISWRQLYVVHVSQSADYTVVCSSSQATRFAVGRQVAVGALVGGILGGIAALLILPGAGTLVAVIIAVVVGVRRGNHRRFLISQRYPPRY